MCDPATIAVSGMALSAATAAGTYAEQSQQASDAAGFQNKRYNDVSASAMEAYQHKLTDLAIRGDQETASASQSAGQNARQGAAARGSLRAGAAAAGVSGNSVDAMLSEFSGIEAENAFLIGTNLRWNREAMSRNAAGFQAEAASRIASVAPSHIRGPSAAAAVVGFAGSSLGWAAWAYDKQPTGSPAK